jgi:hypothetical protein
MRLTLLLGLALAVIPGLAGEASACSCGPGTPCLNASRASAVFLGTITHVESSAYGTSMRLRVERTWKGSLGESIEVSQPPDGGQCGFPVRVGERWVIFASGGPGSWSTSMCSGGWRAGEERRLGRAMPPAGDVVGRLLRPAEHPRRAVPSTEPVAGTRVWVVSPSGTFSSRTDAAGRFRLTGFNLAESGLLRAELAPGEILPPTEIGFGSQEICGELPLLIGYTGLIAGRVVDARGTGVAGAVVSALDLPRGTEAIGTVAAASTSTDESGAYTLGRLRSGRYLVGVNVARPPTIASPFAPTFHPAASQAAAASTVVVSGPATTELAPLVVRRLPQTVLKVEVICRDGTRPADARVEAKPAAGGPASVGRSDRLGHAAVPAMPSVHYAVSAAILVRERARRGVRDAGIFTTDAVMVTSGATPTDVVVRVPLMRCDAPGGPVLTAGPR